MVVVVVVICGLAVVGVHKRRNHKAGLHVRVTLPPVAQLNRAFDTPLGARAAERLSGRGINDAYEPPVTLNPLYYSGIVDGSHLDGVDVADDEHVTPGALYSAYPPPTRCPPPCAVSTKTVLVSHGGTVWEIPLETDEGVPVGHRHRQVSPDEKRYSPVAGFGHFLTHKYENVDV
jgi:hypothetical protein